MKVLPRSGDTHTERLSLARAEFFDEGELPDSGVQGAILRSWLRCRDAGIAHADSSVIEPVGRCRLSEARERSAHLLEQSTGVMEHVFAQIRASGSMVILSDADGLILHSLGDPDFVDRASRVALQPGANWNEVERGTNAIGTTIVEAAPVEVLGSEHYLERNGFLTCAASPIRDADGRIIGVFDISGDSRIHQRHTMGLVQLSVQLLEKRLFEIRFAKNVLIAFHVRPEYVGTLQEGLIAVDPAGLILGANCAARDWLDRARGREAVTSFGALLKSRIGTIFDRAAAAESAHALFRLELRDGTELYAQLRGMRAPMVQGVVPGHIAALPAQQAPKAGSARKPGASEVTLDSLATGDERQQRALDRAKRILGKDIPLLIQGESGVGKELFARAFHHSGPRRDGPFVALNCAAIPENLIESELFGYVGGAFTGARREGSVGKIQQAHGGTLFLDEIGDMPLPMQARLLRVLQERCVTPIGGLKSVPVDLSLVCATHRMLRDAAARGEFREDLYYRVNGLTVTLPPLRERSDIRCLVLQILGTEAAESRGVQVTIAEDVMAFFESHLWPGNVRQLQNVIRVAVALLDDDEDEIRSVHLPEELFVPEEAGDDCEPRRRVHSAVPMADLVGDAAERSQAKSLDQIELDAIAAVMRDVGGNVSAAARRLGVSRNTLYRKLGRMG